MKSYNTPAQAKNLREIEAMTSMPIVRNNQVSDGTVQPVPPAVDKEEEEAGTEVQAEAPTKKARSKKAPKEV